MKNYIWLFEVLWFLFMVMISLLVLLPILSQIDSYLFLYDNLFFIVISFFLFKHSFFIRYSFFARIQWIKILFFFLCIPIIFKTVEKINHFITYIDENTFDPLLPGRDIQAIERVGNYIYTEMIFFGTLALVITLYFAYRMVVSTWRFRNKGVVI